MSLSSKIIYLIIMKLSECCIPVAGLPLSPLSASASLSFITDSRVEEEQSKYYTHFIPTFPSTSYVIMDIQAVRFWENN